MGKTSMATKFNGLFVLIAILDIMVVTSGLSEYRVVTKPLILLSLLIYFTLKGGRLLKPTYYFMLLALFFSLLGDIFLLFEHFSSSYFIAGLVSFLLAHIFYAAVFLRKWNERIPKNFVLASSLLIAYGATLFFFLKDSLGSLKLPVAIYILGILIMVISALGRFEKVRMLSFILVLTGALCFITSDSILAIDRFMFEVPGASILIMGPYALAQLLIVLGVLNQDAHL